MWNSRLDGLAKILIIFGIVLVAIGVVLLFIEKIPFLGKLPGDILVKKEHFTFSFPLTTSIIISLILYLVGKFK